MRGRWRGRANGFAIALVAAALVAVTASASATSIQPGPTLRVVDPTDGSALVTVSLGPDRGFSLRYRNSLYGTLAEERFVITADGRLRLVSLAADQLAVLEEYYAIDEPAVRASPDDRRQWLGIPAVPTALAELAVAATDLGERTLIVEGRAPIELWKLRRADPTVVIEAER
ncbi:MAG: hypothetical protein ACRDGD_10885 [Candidatus Limnocylindria bacterium]